MTTKKAFQTHPIPGTVFDEIRASGVDPSGCPIERVVADGGEPLRCCLRDACPGEQAILFGYEPPPPRSPYRETEAVFAHAQRCAGPADTEEYSLSWRGRPQVAACLRPSRMDTRVIQDARRPRPSDSDHRDAFQP
jgi:hypothetical protein